MGYSLKHIQVNENEYPYRIGLIGLGYGGFVHLPALKKLNNCEIVAVCGATLEKTRDFALLNNISSAFTDWKEMLDKQELDLLVLAVPPAIQVDILKIALTKNIKCFCEKPLSSGYESAKELLLIAQQGAEFCATDFLFPEIPCWLRAKEKISSGKTGKIKHACIHWYVQTEASRTGLHPWKLDRKSGGGVLKNFVSHVIYNIEWMIGEIVSVSCLLDETTPGCDRGACIQFYLKSEIIVNVNVYQDAIAGTGHHFSIYGSKGTIHLNNPEKDYVKGFTGSFVDPEGKAESLNRENDFENDPDGRIMVAGKLFSRWIKSIETKTVMRPNLIDGARVQMLLQALEKANEKKIIFLQV